jgi:hypothetical protein
VLTSVRHPTIGSSLIVRIVVPCARQTTAFHPSPEVFLGGPSAVATSPLAFRIERARPTAHSVLDTLSKPRLVLGRTFSVGVDDAATKEHRV